jgi:hypothetical protein
MTVVKQRGEGDCGVAAIAMVAGRSYAQTARAVAKVDPLRRGSRGLYDRELLVVGALLGVRLEPTRRFNLDRDAGVLRVHPNSARSSVHKWGHFVAVREGLIRCSLHAIGLPWAEYLHFVDGKVGTLLKEIA